MRKSGYCGICKKPIDLGVNGCMYLKIRNGRFAVLFHHRCLWHAPKTFLPKNKEGLK